MFFKRRQRPVETPPTPQGSGEPNRHGLPRLPVGQTATTKWPVLHYGKVPTIERWELVVDGLVQRPLHLSWEDFLRLEQVEDRSDFHCVTGWSRFDLSWQGVRLAHLAEQAGLLPAAVAVMCHGLDGYETNLPLSMALQSDVLLVHTADGQRLSDEHGGPVRVITPRLYAWKGAKWLCRLEFLAQDRPGFWERNGYSNTADPWRDDRYSS